jgi:muconolactone delta-isomerase
MDAEKVEAIKAAEKAKADELERFNAEYRYRLEK